MAHTNHALDLKAPLCTHKHQDAFCIAVLNRGWTQKIRCAGDIIGANNNLVSRHRCANYNQCKRATSTIFINYLRVGNHIFRADRRHMNPQGLHVSHTSTNTVQYEQNVTTMIAHKHDQRPLGLTDIRRTISFTVGTRKLKISRFPTKIEDKGHCKLT